MTWVGFITLTAASENAVIVKLAGLLAISEVSMGRNRYDDKFRAGAIAMLEAQGYPEKKGALAAVAKHLNVPSSTLHRWAQGKNNPPPPELVTEKKGDLAALLRQEAEAILAEMPHARNEASFRDLGVVMGIVLDKLQLLTGQPTERHELVTVRDKLAARLSSIAANQTKRQDSSRLH